MSRTIYILRASISHAAILAVYEKMQLELGAENVYLTFDDTSATWPHSPTIRMTEPRPLRGAPHVLLLNRTECEAVAGSDVDFGKVVCWVPMQHVCCAAVNMKWSSQLS